MKGTGRVHFSYIVGILLAIIIQLATARFADDANLVAYVSFALTLASIVLAVVAIVYSFVANESLSQSIGGIHSTARDLRASADSIDRAARSLGSGVEEVSAKLSVTHDLMQRMSNPPTPPNQVEASEVLDDSQLRAVPARSSHAGALAMYAMAKAYTTGKPFVREKLFDALARVHGDYVYGWLMSMDALGLLDIESSDGNIWHVKRYPQALLEAVTALIKTAPADDAESGIWSRKTVTAIDEFFEAL